MSAWEVIILVVGGLAAGTINSMAGGGSLLTVPILVLVGLDGNVANGSNRVGVLLSNLTGSASFARQGVPGFRQAVPVIIPVLVGSVIGATAIASVAPETFERLFGLVMVPLLFLGLRRPKRRDDAVGDLTAWSPAVSAVVFFGIGLYGGAFQAGVGLILVLALSHAGFDLVTANSVKVVVILALTAVAVPVFILNDQVDWVPALVLGAGFALGGALGARIAVKGGERIIRPVLVVAVIALAGKMLGLY